MKKITFKGKLSLNKKTVARLNDAEMKNLNGGAEPISKGNNCPTKDLYCDTDNWGCKKKEDRIG